MINGARVNFSQSEENSRGSIWGGGGQPHDSMRNLHTLNGNNSSIKSVQHPWCENLAT